ncbi:MAG TPA: phage tail protein [Symbiobacteriaceae bacterium]|nr:phage tail protein [Symbiobacteriaceae bacterium]
MTKLRMWGVIPVVVVLAAALLAGPAPARLAEAAEAGAGAQLLIDGRVVGSFQEVSGLEIEVTAVEAVCRIGGPDDDCDGVATEQWQGDVLAALWQLSAAADDLERGLWGSSRARHDTAKNAIGNIRARVAQTEGALQDSAQSLKTRHDTVKNAIGNIRAAVRAVTTVTGNDEGVTQAELKSMQDAALTLTHLAEGYRHTYRPGRPVYGNITLKGPVGSLSDPRLLDWFKDPAQRKSISIIFLDRSGKRAARYNLFECWPVRFASSELVEEIEFAVERVEREP